MQTVRALTQTLQDYYAERLGSFIVIHVNWFYRFMFQCMKPMLSKRTRDKVNVLGNPKGLSKFIPRDQLLTDYGGTSVRE
mmetsp:Transcript_19958/g.3258  ORF Transcript_19958/g.3258 Transcript_19958/m.3258 type:complete len:80 (-) Transcript_19958:42-281(-)